jgi:hypothetical protein
MNDRLLPEEVEDMEEVTSRLGDALRAALRPFGLSRVSPSQAKPAAAIAGAC